jgi:hypothetical protein
MSSYPEFPATKPPHRDTSERVAKQVAIKHTSIRGRCLALIESRGNLTADECASILHESILNVRPALSALVGMGKLVDSGARRDNAAGNSMIAWRLMTDADVQASFVAAAGASA